MLGFCFEGSQLGRTGSRSHTAGGVASGGAIRQFGFRKSAPPQKSGRNGNKSLRLCARHPVPQRHWVIKISHWRGTPKKMSHGRGTPANIRYGRGTPVKIRYGRDTPVRTLGSGTGSWCGTGWCGSLQSRSRILTSWCTLGPVLGPAS